MSGHEATDYYSTEEARAAIGALSSADLLRLAALYRVRAIGLPSANEHDLLQDALERVIKGTRRWPRGLAVVPFLDKVMRSVANQYRRAQGRQQDQLGVQVVTIGARDSEIESEDIFQMISGGDPTPEEMLVAKQTVHEIESLFDDDDRALGVVLGRAEGHAPDEIQREFDMTQTQYESASKKVNRRITCWIIKG